MQISTVLFDLDGTLLPMDQIKFTNGYFKTLAEKISPYGYEAKELIDSIWLGIKTIMKSDGSQNNETVFWNTLYKVYGEKIYNDKKVFDDFYNNEFNLVKSYCGINPNVSSVIAKLKEAGYRLVVATNPIFPKIATHSRIKWAGLNPDDFELITTYENSNYCKPSHNYYAQILDKINVNPQNCIMVGNDVSEDMPASALGMNVFLLTDCLLNKNDEDISQYPSGGFDDLLNYLKV